MRILGGTLHFRKNANQDVCTLVPADEMRSGMRYAIWNDIEGPSGNFQA